MEKIGKYEILREIGQGGMGKVYQARDQLMGRVVAIKLMSEAEQLDKTLRERFYREAQAAGNLKHPNIVTIYDLAEEKGVPYIVMEYLEGTDLKQLMKEGKPLPLYDKLKIVVQVANGLSYAHHHGIVHRDIKPANIRVLEGGQIKIMDFGIARIQASDMTRTGLTMGTWHYMSPEQIVGKRVDSRADIWALGVVLYELVCGSRPFNADSITALVYEIAHREPTFTGPSGSEIPEPLAAVLSRALAKQPEDRYQDAADMARELESYVSAMSTSVEHLQTEIQRDIRKYLQLASALLLKKQYNEAVQAARRVLVLDPESAEGKELVAKIEKERDRAEREEKALPLAAEAQALLRDRHTERAVERAGQALAQAPESTKIKKIHAEVTAAVERIRREEALATRLKAAQIALDAKKLSEAAAELRAALDIDPQNRDAKRLLDGVVKAAKKEEEQKEKDKVLSEARSASSRKRYKEARHLLEAYLSRHPEDTEVRVLLRETLDSETAVEQATSVQTVIEPRPEPPRPEPPRPPPPKPRPVEPRPIERPREPAPTAGVEVATRPTPGPQPRRGLYVAIAAVVVAAIAAGVWFILKPTPASATGQTSINISPWAEILSIKEIGTGRVIEPDIKVTPCHLTLPAGRYEFLFSNPHFPQQLSLEQEVVAGQTVELKGVIPGFNHADFIPDF